MDPLSVIPFKFCTLVACLGVIFLTACGGNSDDDDEFAATGDDVDDSGDDTGGGVDAAAEDADDDGGDVSQGVCGDGNTDDGEQCDGNELAGATCVDLGHSGGALVCSSSCTIDESGCTDDTGAECGNESIEDAEECDGIAFGGESCAERGFDFGTLSCSGNCTIDDSGCGEVPICGDGLQEADEACDDGNLDDGDGCDRECALEVCGDGIVQTALDEECDTGGASYSPATSCPTGRLAFSSAAGIVFSRR